MNSTYRDLLRHSGIYGAGQVLSRLASIALLPLYTSYLRPADYGVIAILDLIMNLLVILVSAAIGPAAARYHFDRQDEAERDRVWWTGLTVVVVGATLTLLPAWLMRRPLADLALGEVSGPYYLSLALPTFWLTVVEQFLLVYLRVRKWSVWFVAVSVGRLLVNIALNVYLLVGLDLGIAGVLLGNLIAGALGATVLLILLVGSRGRYVYDARVGAQMWRFGWPLLITGLLSVVMHQADRYYLRLFHNLHEVGIYSLAYQVGQGVNALFLIPFSAIWSVQIYEIADQPQANASYTSVFRYFVYGLALLLFGVSLFAAPILSLIGDPQYADAADLVPTVCLAYFFFSLHDQFKIPALLAKRTSAMLPVFVAGAMANIVLNFALIPVFGPHGAAWGAVGTFATFAFVGLFRYRRIEAYAYPFRDCAAALGGIIATFVALRAIEPWLASGVVAGGLRAAIWVGWCALLFGGPIIRLFGQERLDAVGHAVR